MASIESNVDDGSQLCHEGDVNAEHDSEESKQVVCCLCHDQSSRHPISFLILLQVYDGSTVHRLLARSCIGCSYLRFIFENLFTLVLSCVLIHAFFLCTRNLGLLVLLTEVPHHGPNFDDQIKNTCLLLTPRK
jgi:prepilin signal peptidase PulO-like enzyme (type II secretory pathway)